MNPDTMELRVFKDRDEMMKGISEGFIPIPGKLCRAARIKLGKKESIIVSKTSGGKLSKWAAKKRRERKKQKQMIAACNEYYKNLATMKNDIPFFKNLLKMCFGEEIKERGNLHNGFFHSFKPNNDLIEKDNSGE